MIKEKIPPKIYWLVLAWNQIWRTPKRTWTVVIACILGMTCVFIITGFMNGMLLSSLKQNIRSGIGLLQVRPPGYSLDKQIQKPLEQGNLLHNTLQKKIEKHPTLSKVQLSYRLERDGFIQSDTKSQGILFMGIEPSLESKVSAFSSWTTQGDFLFQQNSLEKQHNIIPVVIGDSLATKLNVQIKDTFVGSISTKESKTNRFLLVVKGIYKSSSTDLENNLILMHINHLAYQYSPQATSSLISYLILYHDDLDFEIPLKNLVMSTLASSAPLSVLTYSELQPLLSIFQSLGKKMNVILYFILLLGFCLTLYDSLAISIKEREHSIGIMRGIGTSTSYIRLQLFTESFYITSIGIFIGSCIGVISNLIMSYIGIPINSFSEGLALLNITSNKLRPFLQTDDILTALTTSFILAFFATLLPIRRVLKNTILENLYKK